MKLCTLLPTAARLCAALAGLALFAGAAFAQTASASTGTIEGRVLDLARGSYLNNARITVEGTTIETFTNAFGEYRLNDVPAGGVKLRTFYTGLAAQMANITLLAGQTVTKNFDLTATAVEGPVVQLDKFVVSSTRQMAGFSIAINEQRFALNIKNVVAADEFGDINEGNVGEFVKFLPGITIEYVAADARAISVRGLPSSTTPVSIDGNRMASAASSTMDRRFELEETSLSNMARIEVVKSPTPDLAADMLGGTVNMISKRAFELARPQFSYSAFLSANPYSMSLGKSVGPTREPTRKIKPGFEFTYTNPVSKRFGFTISASNHNKWNQEIRSTKLWVPHVSGLATVSPDNPYVRQYTVNDNQKPTSRASLSATADWKFTPTDVLSLSLSDGYYEAMTGNRSFRFDVGSTQAASWGPTFTQGAAGRGSVSFDYPHRFKYGTTWSPSFKYRHDGRVWKFDVGGSYSAASSHYRDTERGYFASVQPTLSNVTVRFDDMGEFRPGRFTVTDAAGATVDPYKLSNFTTMTTAASSVRDGFDIYRQAHANLQRDLNLAVPASIKIGVDYRQNARGLIRTDRSWAVSAPASEIAGLYDPALAQKNPPDGQPNIQWPSLYKAYDLYVAHPEYFTLNQAALHTSIVNNSFKITETVSAAYLRGDLRLFQGKLVLVGGVRFERTEDDGLGPLNDPTAWYQRDASGAIVRNSAGQPIATTTDLVARARLQYRYLGSHSKKSYGGYYPSMNATYNLTENLIARAAYARTLGRPNYTNIAPGVTLSDPAAIRKSVSVKNPDLKPWQANNYDLSLEYYFKPAGVISLSAYRKDIADFFGTNTIVGGATAELLAEFGVPSDYLGADWSTSLNAGDARVTGVELNYKQALTFLPHWARGVQVFASGGTQRLQGSNRADFTSFVPKTASWGVSLSRSKYSAKINWNYKGRQRLSAVTGTGIPGGIWEYEKERMYIDINLEYRIRRGLTAFAAVSNVNNQGLDDLRFGPSTPAYARLNYRESYGGIYSVGVKGTF